MLKFIISLLLLFFSISLSGQSLPSSITKQLAGKTPKEQSKLLDSIAFSLRNENMPLSVKVYNYNLQHCAKNKLHKALVKSYLGLSRNYRTKGIYDTALIYIDSAKSYAFTNKVHEQYGNVYDYEGLTYMRMSENDKATASFFKSISYSEKENDSTKIRDAFDHLGTVDFYRSDYKGAINFYKKGLAYISPEKNKQTFASTYDNIGLCFANQNILDSALFYQKKALGIFEQLNDSTLLAESYINIGSTLLLLKNTKEAEVYLKKAYDINNTLHNEYGQILSNLYIGRLYMQSNRNTEAIEPLEHAFNLAKKLKLPAQIKETSSSLAEALEKKGDYKNSILYMRELVNVMEEIFQEENSKSINELSAKYETEKKQQQILLLTKDSDLQQQTIQNDRYLKIIYVAIAVLFLLLSIFFIYRFREKKKDNQLLQEKNDAIALQKNQIENQKEELLSKNKEITDSINYAKRIQGSVIASDNLVKSLLPDSFIYFQPKDIVSGDFYWLAEKNNCVYFAVADCTGHGVPGAMMSMLGTSLLNQILSNSHDALPSEILKKLHFHVVKSLNEDMEHRISKDGMDMSLIMIDKANKRITYSGAGRPLYFVQNNALEIIKPDKFSIGGVFDAHEIQFASHEIRWASNIQLYMFSDGVPDQFGGPKGKKFMTKQLQDLIVDMASLPITQQYSKFKEVFEAWKKDVEQTDDVTLAAIQLN